MCWARNAKGPNLARILPTVLLETWEQGRVDTMQAYGGTAQNDAQAIHTVLVVEDEPAVREMVADFLRDEGYTVEEARDGAEAIRSLDNHCEQSDHLCAVLLDMM